jgi:hypothetical protein
VVAADTGFDYLSSADGTGCYELHGILIPKSKKKSPAQIEREILLLR